ncbi:MAG: ABC transporter permease [Muribaculaceae bacterium]|nr:ABC transporter permease [Muribaculaceae bacterium]
MNNTSLVIKREYLERVNKKSFIITTLIVPIVMVALMAVPTLIMLFAPSSDKNIAVLDNSGLILPQLKDTDDVHFFAADAPQDEMLSNDSVYGLLIIDRNIVANPSGVRILTSNTASAPVERTISDQMEKIIQDEKLKGYDIENLDDILKDVRTSVTVRTIKVSDADDEGEEQSAALNSVGGMMLNFVLYFFITMYGALIMNSIIEEKGNRVLEIIVSSVKPTQLMLGKIVGVGLVALTQILIWGVVIMACTTLILPMVIPADVMADVQAINAGTGSPDPEAMGMDVDVAHIIGTLSNTGYVAYILSLTLVFLVLGYLLYAAIFAMIGASVDNVQDASQLNIIAMLPIMIGFFAAMVIIEDPSSTFAIILSMVPFTAPMVMMARVPFGVPAWELATAICVLIASVIGFIWLAGKIYRVGIFMYGKKPTFRDLARWITYK